MKQKLLFALAAIAGAGALTACSNDDIADAPVQEPSGISFEGFVNKSTRGSDLTMTTLKEFAVYGMVFNPSDATAMAALFDGTKVSLNGTNWTYTPQRYWVSGNDYIFSAFAPLPNTATGGTSSWTFTPTAAVDTSFTYTGMGTLTFDNQAANANQDLIYAFAKVKNAKSTQAPVSFNFDHLLSRVMFTFENAFSSTGSYIEISDVTVTDVNSKGTIDLMAQNPAWTITPGSTFARQFELVTNNGVEFNNQGTAATTWYYFIPTSQTYTLTFTAKLYSGSENGDVLAGTFQKTCTLPSVDMKPGYSYNFTASIDEDNISSSPLNPIVFTVSGIENWEDFTSAGSATFPSGN